MAAAAAAPAAAPLAPALTVSFSCFKGLWSQNTFSTFLWRGRGPSLSTREAQTAPPRVADSWRIDRKAHGVLTHPCSTPACEPGSQSVAAPGLFPWLLA